MRSSKHEFIGNRTDEKAVITIHYFVPSSKRFKEMSNEDVDLAIEWMSETIGILKVIRDHDLKHFKRWRISQGWNTIKNK